MTDKEEAIKRVADEVSDPEVCAKVAKKEETKDSFFGTLFAENGIEIPKFDVHAHAAGRRGERDEMQDTHSIIFNLWNEDGDNSKSKESRKRLSFFAVFDGHAGARAAEYCEKQLHKYFLNQLQFLMEMAKDGLLDDDDAEDGLSPKNIKRCIIDAFKETNSEFLKIASTNKMKDGCTAIVVILFGDTAYIANLGDSGAVLCKKTGEATTKSVALSKEHNPTVYSERMRIQKAGGFVKNGRVQGIIEVSRSIGDGGFKHLGVVCVPEIVTCQLGANSETPQFIILGCDGLWNVLSKPEVVKFTYDYITSEAARKAVDEILDQQELSQPKQEENDKEKVKRNRLLKFRQSLVQMTVKSLVNEAVRKGSTDNVSALLICFG